MGSPARLHSSNDGAPMPSTAGWRYPGLSRGQPMGSRPCFPPLRTLRLMSALDHCGHQRFATSSGQSHNRGDR